jgi:hypothetical protein
LEGKIFSWDLLMTTVLFRFLLVYGRTILVLQFFFINLPLTFGDRGIIRSKIGSKRVDLILIRLAKCWNNFFSSKFCIWLYCENGKYIYNTCALSKHMGNMCTRLRNAGKGEASPSLFPPNTHIYLYASTVHMYCIYPAILNRK